MPEERKRIFRERASQQPLLKEAEQLIKKVLKIDDYEAAKLAELGHLVGASP